jgi:hypothetical protein
LAFAEMEEGAMRTKLTAVAVLAGAAATLVAVAAAGSVAAHFAGFPPAGVKPSMPTTGKLVISLRPAHTEWNVYADGRIIWQKWTPSGDASAVPKGARRLDTGYVHQRLTLPGVELLRSKLLATRLFEQDLRLDLGRHAAWVFHQVRSGDRMVTVSGVSSPDPSWNEHFTKPTPPQTLALAWIEALVAAPAKWLPPSVWADRQIRAFVPSRYVIAFDRSYPDISKLPPPAGKVLSQYQRLRRHGCQVVTTGRARALLQAFVRAGISPSENHAREIGFDFHGLHLPHPSWLHLGPALPSSWC